MNNAMRRLTFITLMVGAFRGIASVFEMNFEIEYFITAERLWAYCPAE
jgi:Mg2+ and Co2+ transporter CorA